MSNSSETLIEWYIHNKRDLPWRNTNSPYFIWLSEIILQQTRVNQGLNYYLKFISKYPDIEKLASANLDDVLKLWQGLGYYTRARNMHSTAKIIVDKYEGLFPASYNELLKLKGIGTYTAAAIASFAYKEPIPVIDGNVLRVLSRLFAEDTPVHTAKGKAIFGKLAEKILDRDKPDLHNQAVMELGALVCMPKTPLCHICPLASVCKANQAGLRHAFPVRKSRSPLRIRHFNYLMLKNQEKFYIVQRQKKDIWHSLYEFPLIETPKSSTAKQLFRLKEWKNLMNGNPYIIKRISKPYKHKLTHQVIIARFFEIAINDCNTELAKQFILVSWNEFFRFAVPRLIERYLQDLKPDANP